MTTDILLLEDIHASATPILQGLAGATLLGSGGLYARLHQAQFAPAA